MEFIEKEGKWKAFHTGGNSSCRAHIRQHYKLYQERCKEANIPEQHWAIPRAIWNGMEEEQRRKKAPGQGTLDFVVMKLVGPQVFTRENLLHAVTQFVTINDQVRLTVDIALNTPDESTSRLQLQTNWRFETVWLRCSQKRCRLIYQALTMSSITYTTSLYVGWVSWRQKSRYLAQFIV